MKKFSNITNQKVAIEPEKNIKIDEKLDFKLKVINLMEQLLRVRSYGSVDNRYLAGSVSIEGKEMLAEAIIDLLTESNKNEKVELLESLKTQITDWESIDNKIKSIENNKTSFKNRNKINKLIESCDNDEESTLLIINEKSKNIQNIETLNEYITIINENRSLTDDLKFKINKIYSDKIKQIESN